MLRIFLAIVIVAGAVGIGFTFKVSDKIKSISEARDGFEKQKTEAEETANKATIAAKKSKEAEEKAKKDFAATKDELDKTTQEKNSQMQRAATLEQQLTKTTQDRNEAQQDLAAWKALGVQPDQIKKLQGDLKMANESVEASAEEKKILNRSIVRLKADLSRYTGESEVVDLPVGIKGKVVAVDPRFEFVVIDVGSNAGVLERGELLINRGGKLVAKVRVTSVQPNRSVANILPGWKQAEVLMGDQVLR